MEQLSLGPSGHGLSVIGMPRMQLISLDSDHTTQLVGTSNMLHEENDNESGGLDQSILPFIETEEGGQVIFRGIVDQNGAVILDAAQFAALMNSVSADQSARESIPPLPSSRVLHSNTITSVGSVISAGKTLPLTSSHRNQPISMPTQCSTTRSTFQEQQIRPSIVMQTDKEATPALKTDPTNLIENFQNNGHSSALNPSSVGLETYSKPENVVSSVSTSSSAVTTLTASKNETQRLETDNTPTNVQAHPHPSTCIDIEPPIGKGPYRCQDCGKTFPKWPQFKRHKVEHLDEKSHRCPLCPMTFNFETNLKLHQMIHEAEISGCLECQVCPAKFSRLASLKSHVRVHEKEENLVCPECGDEFATKVRLDAHIEEHKTTKPLLYRCKLCGKSFTQSALLRSHAQEHTAVRNQLKILTPRRRKPVQPSRGRNASEHTLEISKSRERIERKKTLLCAICAKRFQKPSQLSRHVRIHTGEKPYVCKHCGRSFNQKGTLESHVLSMHEKLKPYVCHLCNCQFSQRGNLKAHVLKVHVPPGDDERVFKCQECSCVYRRLATLNTHISKSHSKSSQVPLIDGNSNNNQPSTTETSEKELQEPIPSQEIECREEEKDGSEEAQHFLLAAEPSSSSLKSPSNSSKDLLNIPGNSSKDGIISQITEVNLAHETQSGKAITCVVNVQKIGPDKWHLCNLCSKSFRKPSDLIRHVRIHTLERPFKCHDCMKCFALKSTLNNHLKTHSSQKDFECRVCHKRFSVTTTLRAHERLHTGAKPYPCLQCGKGFRTSSQRKVHSKVHSRNAQGPTGKRKLLRIGVTEPKIELPDPLKITSEGLVSVPNRTSLSILKPNSVQDSKLRPYRCSQCPSGFKKSSHLKQHTLSHSKERPYKCFQCYRSFTTNGILKNHIKTHEGVRAYKCQVCQLSFTTNGSLTRHMVAHTDARPFVCPYCHKTFKTSVTCRKHIKTHRSEFVAFRTNVDDLTVENSPTPNGGDEVQRQDIHIVGDHQNFQSGYQASDDIYADNEDDHFENSFSIGDAASSNVNLRLPQTHHVTIGSIQLQHNALLTSIPQNSSSGMDDSIGSMQQQIQDITELIAESGQRLSTPGGEVTLQYSLATESQIEEVAHQISLAEGQHFDGSIFNLQGGEGIELPSQLTSLLPQENPPDSGQNSESASAFVQTLSNLKFQLPIDTNNYHLKQSTIYPNVIQLQNNLDTGSADQPIEASLKDSRIQELILSSKPISEKIFNEMTTKPIIDSAHSAPTEQFDEGEIIESDKTKVNKCQQCGRGFRKRSDLLRHIRIHTGEKPFRCHICGKAFRVKSTREAHIRTHEGGKTVACHVCHNLFSTKSSLRVHIRLHTGAKPYKCLHCDRWFRTSGHRKAHALSHFKIPKDLGNTSGAVVSNDINQKFQVPQVLNVSHVLPPVETIKDKTLISSQSSINDSTTGYPTSVTTSLSDPVQIIGSLQLTLDGPTVQNIQITGLDLNNLQLSEDFLQSLGNVIFMAPNQLSMSSSDLGSSNMIGITLPNSDVNINQLISSQIHPDPSMSHMVNQTASVLTGKDVNVGNTVTNMPPFSQRLMQNTDSSTISMGDLDSISGSSEHNLICGFSSLSSSVPSGTPLISSEAQKSEKSNSSMSQSMKQCPTCGKVFAKPSLLKRHMRLHTGAKPYQCDVCGCTFNQKNSLDAHMYTHSNERPFVCSVCPFKAVVKAALKKHCSRAHPNLNFNDMITTTERVIIPKNDAEKK